MDVEHDIARLVQRVESDETARRAMWLVWLLGVLVLIVVGRHQWFMRDDWAFVYSRPRFRETAGLDSMLLTPQDGHWMTWPILTFRALHGMFGVRTYLPYLVTLWATHIGLVILVRVWLRRFGVSAWTTTLASAVLLVFGAGWENLLFAVQITYNFSLLAFLGQMLLVDHDGPVDRRDWIGSGLSLLGVSSSGFGPFFGFGVAVLLTLRRRWTAACVAVIPQAVAWLWWWFTWGGDKAGEQSSAGLSFVLHFAEFGMWSAFGGFVGTGILGWPAIVLCVAIVFWSGTGMRRRTVSAALLATIVATFLGIGNQREVFGMEAAGWPRYQYVAMVLAVPVLAFGLDQAPRFASWARWVPRLLLVFALARNIGWLRQGGDGWADQAEADRRLFSLVAGSPERSMVPVERSMSEVSPDVQVRNLDELVEHGAITPVVPTTAEERALVARALGLP